MNTMSPIKHNRTISRPTQNIKTRRRTSSQSDWRHDQTVSSARTQSSSTRGINNLQLGYYIVPLLCVGCVWQPPITEHDNDDDDDDDEYLAYLDCSRKGCLGRGRCCRSHTDRMFVTWSAPCSRTDHSWRHTRHCAIRPRRTNNARTCQQQPAAHTVRVYPRVGSAAL